jgi:hypothetical protein
VTGPYGFVGAGHGNTAGTMAVVAGGVYHSALGTFSTIGGGAGNTNMATSATLAGGAFNLVGADSRGAVIGGGESNSISPASVGSVIEGGVRNLIGLQAGLSTIGGGQDNTVLLTSWSSIGGGRGSYIWGADEGYCTIAGGEENTIAPSDLLGSAAPIDYSTIGGGHRNRTGAAGATVGGGKSNDVLGIDGVIAGGNGNRAWGNRSTVGGGVGNLAAGRAATVAGGAGNSALGAFATVGGGGDDHGPAVNQALGDSSTVAGGTANAATSTGSTLAGGTLNRAAGTDSFVAGGRSNAADGATSFAAGRRARALHEGSFVWADSRDEDFASTAANQVSIRAAGGVRLSDDTPELSFGGSLRQMVNLWNGKYGIGIQDSTMYFRCDNGTPLDGFAWFRGGQHHDGRRRAGGGQWLMTLDASGLDVNAGTITAFEGVRWSLGGALVDNQGGSIELGPASGDGQTPFVDFHFGANAAEDFNVRLINDRDRELAFFRSGFDRTSVVEMARLKVLGLRGRPRRQAHRHRGCRRSRPGRDPGAEHEGRTTRGRMPSADCRKRPSRSEGPPAGVPRAVPRRGPPTRSTSPVPPRRQQRGTGSRGNQTRSVNSEDRPLGWNAARQPAPPAPFLPDDSNAGPGVAGIGPAVSIVRTDPWDGTGGPR